MTTGAATRSIVVRGDPPGLWPNDSTVLHEDQDTGGSALGRFLRRAVAYEALPAPMSPQLRMALWISFAVTLVGGLMFPAFQGEPHVGGWLFFWVRPLLQGVLSFLHDIWLIALVLNIAAVATLVILTIRTRGFTQATRVENWVSVGPVAAASGDALAVSLIVALVILSIIIWLVIVAFCVAAVIGLVVILANSQSSS